MKKNRMWPASNPARNAVRKVNAMIRARRQQGHVTTRHDAKELRLFAGGLATQTAPSYPVVPAWYPNRAVRRAVCQHRESRLSKAWVAYLAMSPDLRKTIRSM